MNLISEIEKILSASLNGKSIDSALIDMVISECSDLPESQIILIFRKYTLNDKISAVNPCGTLDHRPKITRFLTPTNIWTKFIEFYRKNPARAKTDKYLVSYSELEALGTDSYSRIIAAEMKPEWMKSEINYNIGINPNNIQHKDLITIARCEKHFNCLCIDSAFPESEEKFESSGQFKELLKFIEGFGTWEN